MFAGMSFCLPLALARGRLARADAAAVAAAAEAATPLLLGVDPAPPAPPSPSQARIVALLAIPTGFDLVATVLMNVGLLNVTVSRGERRERETEERDAAARPEVLLPRNLRSSGRERAPLPPTLPLCFVWSARKTQAARTPKSTPRGGPYAPCCGCGASSARPRPRASRGPKRSKTHAFSTL